MLGKIDSVDDSLQFSQTKSTAPLGEHTFALIPLLRASFEYSDAKDAPGKLSEVLKAHDAILYICRAKITFSLSVPLPVSELPKFSPPKSF